MATESFLLDEILSYAARGWLVFPVHFPVSGGGCSCRKAHDCPSAGKHPRHSDWANVASADESQLRKWWKRWPDANVGLLLGPSSGIVDIEFDDQRGRELAERLLGDIRTPTYSSQRSVHRLFRWTDFLPDVQKVETGGLECRLGGGGKACQSVLPPSLHESGRRYAWEPGLGPGDVDVAVLPQSLLSLIYGDETTTPDAAASRAGVVYNNGTVKSGERNTIMLSFACSQAARARNLDDPDEQAHLYMVLRGVNAVQCVPPLDETELAELHRKAIEYARRDVSTGKATGERTLTAHGLERHAGVWLPGTWRLTHIRSDPPAYRLHVPAWMDKTPDGTGNVPLTVEEYDDYRAVARAVLRSTGTVVLNETPDMWRRIWDGADGKPATARAPAVAPRRALKSHLMDTRDEIDPPAHTKKIVMMADYMRERIDNATDAVDNKPFDGAGATRMADGTVWFRWRKFWADGVNAGSFGEREPNRVGDRIGVTKADSQLWPHHGTPRHRFTVLTSDHIAALNGLCDA